MKNMESKKFEFISEHGTVQGDIEGGGDRVSVHFAVTFLDC